MNIQKKIKWYNPSFSVGISKPYFKVEYLGQQIKYNDINYYFVLNQYIDLPKDYLLSIDYMYNNGGTRGSVKFKPYQRLNASLKKTFLKKKLEINLKANDIFKTLKYKEDQSINNIHLLQTEDFRPWSYSINIKYIFNKKKSKYRGASATDEMNRLNF